MAALDAAERCVRRQLTVLNVTLQGAADSTVLVDGLSVLVVSQDEPIGNAFVCPVGGASGSARSINVDLERDGVVTHTADGGEPANKFSFTLTRGEIETFHITARAERARCEWTAELNLIVDGKRRTVYIDDDGQPFRTCGAEGLPQWRGSTNRWVPHRLPGVGP